MDKRTSLYFIALLPPQEIQDYANRVKQYFASRYNSRHAQKSPPHITLQAPFEWDQESVSVLEQSLQNFANQRPSIPISLSGFAAFPPRVIYINVVKTPPLLTLQADLMDCMMRELGIVDPMAKQRPWAPHMTVAFKDLTKQNFKAAWPEFEHKPVQFEFTANYLTLLIHDGGRWHVSAEFPFLPANG
ncbi:2'-5' RNA ligase family protein [Microseira sp. BLCC-F43]|jgi:2'-5' RNA ligase|uniref:2'-5' RNA ligase family protein n=1 Tax=Microseira sp. BLCC-F43 TaxID=3153602 RepID=UPI0035B766BA